MARLSLITITVYCDRRPPVYRHILLPLSTEDPAERQHTAAEDHQGDNSAYQHWHVYLLWPAPTVSVPWEQREENQCKHKQLLTSCYLERLKKYKHKYWQSFKHFAHTTICKINHFIFNNFDRI